MLATLVDKLVCPSCWSQDQPLSAHVFEQGTDGHIRHGVLACPSCDAWFPIADDLLELVVPALFDPEEYDHFCSRFWAELEQRELKPAAGGPSLGARFQAQLKQRQHFDWYADNHRQDYTAYQHSPFWMAADALAFDRWKKQIQPRSWLLDVGCANGRSALPFADGTTTVIGFDISRKMVRQAIERARSAQRHGTTTFFVADGSRFPLRDQCMEYVLVYGVLHHLPGPGRVCREVVRVLVPGGTYFGSENNQSVFRGLFDLLMKIRPLWTEEAGEQPLLSQHLLRDWLRDEPVDLTFSTSVFLPPHLFNLAGRRLARALMVAMDRLCSRLPGLRHQGGLLVFRVQKWGRVSARRKQPRVADANPLVANAR